MSENQPNKRPQPKRWQRSLAENRVAGGEKSEACLSAIDSIFFANELDSFKRCARARCDRSLHDSVSVY